MNSIKIMRSLALLLALLVCQKTANAGPLNERIIADETVRLGYSEYAPWSYTGENGEALGFLNVYAIKVLKQMGHEKIEAVSMDWGSLTPALKANRIDIMTGGMYIKPERCEHVAFSEPMMRSTFALVVKEGNPSGLKTFEDIVKKDAIFVGYAGSAELDVARAAGVPEENIMPLPGLTEIIAALKSGRGHAVALPGASAVLDIKDSGVEIANENLAPEHVDYITLAFRNEDADFVVDFDKVQAKYLGSADMLAALEPEGYPASALPGDVTRETLCTP